MEKIDKYISIINTEIANINLNYKPSNLYSPISYTLKNKGKRIRPALLLMANNIFGGNTSNAINAALSIEIFHNFTLVHDDIMDNAPLRRGNPTVYKKWNSNIAILSGDVMLVKAYQYLIKSDAKLLEPLINLFNQTAIQVCEGQQLDMNYEESNNVTIDDYLKMIEYKTAVLLGCSLKMGAMLAKTSPANQQHIYDFGKNLGIAFQLMDDILDLYGSSSKIGKQIGGDIISNKKTFLLLKAFDIADSNQRKELEFCLNSKVLDDATKILRVKRIFDQLKVKEEALEEMNLFYNTAIANLDSIDVELSKKAALEDFAKSLMKRDK